jgi:DNA primase
MIPESFIQELVNRVDIVDLIDKSVPLKKAGANYQACCPFHQEKSPSFTVSPTKQFYHCFGCGAHGTAIGFLMEYQGLSFVEAIQELAKSAGMVVPQQQAKTAEDVQAKTVSLGLLDVLQKANDYYRGQLKQSTVAIDYLKQRGLTGQIAARFQIGYAPQGWQNLQAVFNHYDEKILDTAGLVVSNEQGRRYDRFRHRVMFPIHDQKGQVIGFGGRVINPEDTPKYYNSPETPLFQKGNELYGLFLARRAIRDSGKVLVVEGYMDVVALAQHGIDFAVATLGTATTPNHVVKLMRHTDHIIFSFDGDNAGRSAAWRAAMNALPVLTDGLRLSFLFLPTEHDPDSYVREFGKAKFEQMMQSATPLSQYLLQYLTEQNPLTSQEDKVKFLKQIEPILQQIRASKFRLLLEKSVADILGLTVPALREHIRPAPKPSDPAKAPQKLQRKAFSIYRKLLLILLQYPQLAKAEDLPLLEGNDPEQQLFSQAIQTALRFPDSNAAGLLQQMQLNNSEQISSALYHDMALMEKNDLMQTEYEEGMKKLRVAYLHKIRETLLKKSLSELTEQEKDLLKNR